MISDEDLMKNVTSGNTGSLGLLFERYHRELYNFFAKTTGNSEASSDLTQTVFYRILKYKKSYKEGQRFRTWMYQIARNVRTDEFKEDMKSAMNEDISNHNHLIKDHAGEQKRTNEESIELLQLAMVHISEEKRDLITYGILMEMSSEELAEIFNITPNNARVRLHRALLELKGIYQKIN